MTHHTVNFTLQNQNIAGAHAGAARAPPRRLLPHPLPGVSQVAQLFVCLLQWSVVGFECCFHTVSHPQPRHCSNHDLTPNQLLTTFQPPSPQRQAAGRAASGRLLPAGVWLRGLPAVRPEPQPRAVRLFAFWSRCCGAGCPAGCCCRCHHCSRSCNHVLDPSAAETSCLKLHSYAKFLGILTLESFSASALGLAVGAVAPSTEVGVHSNAFCTCVCA